MKVRELAVSGAWEFTPTQHRDDRGLFLEWLNQDALREAVGHPLWVAQANHGMSRRGVVRGVHFAEVPPGQAKHVYCPRGSVLDVVVDLRVGSPTFGRYDAVLLDTVDQRAVYVAEGLGHAYLALEDDTVLAYLCSEGYNPGREHTVSALDPDLALPWPADITPVLSDRDRAAPSLREAEERGLLPSHQACLDFYRELGRQGGQ